MRLFHIVDNRYVAKLGSSFLLIHNIQFNIVTIGQFLGIAASTTALIYWNRPECRDQQRSILSILVKLSFGLSFAIASCVFLFRHQLFWHFSIPKELNDVTILYLTVGLTNMTLTAIFGCLDGILIAAGKLRQAMMLSCFMMVGNVIGDHLALWILEIARGGPEEQAALAQSLLGIGLTTTLLLILAVGWAKRSLNSQTSGREKPDFIALVKIWAAEIGVVAVRSMAPLIYSLQAAKVTGSGSFLVTYNLGLHIAFIACLPLGASIQIAVREASRQDGDQPLLHHRIPPEWWPNFLYFGLFPTVFFLLLSLLFTQDLNSFFYGYALPLDHYVFSRLFFLACIVGQLGHIFAISLRAKKLSHLVTKSFLFSDFVLHLSVVQILIFLNRATPQTLGLAFIAFTSTYFLITYFYFTKINKIDSLWKIFDKGRQSRMIGSHDD